MSTYNIDFYEDLTKIIFQLTPYHFFYESKLVCLIFAFREQQSAKITLGWSFILPTLFLGRLNLND